MVKRDLLVQWRDKWEFVFRVGMLPFILILVYGYMLPVVFLGSIFYTWKQLAPLLLTVAGIAVWVVGMGTIALKRFDRMVYNH
ncbi:MAG: hypothetical protein PUE98_02605 [Galactobacillus timonensis]|uniref:hypothetical protein n=1 Tax=Galactobacillus timonensis TaxID=2041840 RepID=UPI002409009F|nr:hypothetical protein [Galactobacillus timonensis]MDD5851949.1 hypothetical protein [Galactobacillus timonensis]MDD6599343.1 hypothetical protein [Galactobacillus timonensis]